jgi:hypothetical protein
LRGTSVRDLAPALNLEPQRHSIDFGFAVTVIDIGVSHPQWVASICSAISASSMRVDPHFRVERTSSSDYCAMAMSLLRQGTACRKVRKLRTLSSKSQSYKAK